MTKTARGPPPGLGSNKSGLSGGSGSMPGSGTNGWIGGSLTGRVSGGGSNWAGNNNSWHSTWLLLKNLTAQVRKTKFSINLHRHVFFT